MPLRLIFMGTPDFAVPTLLELAAREHEIAAVYTRAAKPAGRGMDLQLTPVEREAKRLGLPVFTPGSLKSDEVQATFRAHKADVAVVIAYGLILPKTILDASRLGCFNVHASLLPRWRGAAPINRAIMAGDVETGVSIMRMDEGLDTGSVCTVERVPIGPEETAGELHDRLASLGAKLMVEALDALERRALDCHPQPGQGTYAEKVDSAEARIDFRVAAGALHDRIRGLSPHPGAWFEMELNGKPERIKVLRATLDEGTGPPGTVLDRNLTIACGEGSVRFTEVQRAGKRPMTAEEFLRGVQVPEGTVLA